MTAADLIAHVPGVFNKVIEGLANGIIVGGFIDWTLKKRKARRDNEGHRARPEGGPLCEWASSPAEWVALFTNSTEAMIAAAIATDYPAGASQIYVESTTGHPAGPWRVVCFDAARPVYLCRQP